MKILIVTDAYSPEIRSASDLMEELAEELNNRGHQITVITNWPKYNLDQDTDNLKYKEKEIDKGITILRIKTLPHHNVNYLLRGFAELFMPIKFLWKLRQYKINPDTIIVYSPPLTLALVGSWFWNKSARFILNVQDLFPQNAIDLKILNNYWYIRFFRALEEFAYRSAHVVTLHSEGNYRTLLQKYPNFVGKFRVLHNWVDISRHNGSNGIKVDFRKKWNIQQKHIAVFAGVIGPSQHLELLLQIAEEMQDCSELLFLLVGDGKEKAKLQEQAKNKFLKNVRFEQFISRGVYPDLLHICSIGLVCLSPQNKTPVVPGKILGYMAAGLPVAAFLQKSSDGHAIIKSAQCGVSVDSSNKDACVYAMQKLISNSASFLEMGKRGKSFVAKNFSKEVCVSKLEPML